jgi:signal transduction histidine kinase
MDGASRTLLCIINDILDMSELEKHAIRIGRSRFDFKEMITSLGAMFFDQCAQKNVAFHAVVEGVTEEALLGDSLRLNQILLEPPFQTL